jgi:predicted RNase H-like HicB family nuclease
MARKALSGHIATLCEAGEPLPEPSTFDQVMSDPAFRHGAAFFVELQ